MTHTHIWICDHILFNIPSSSIKQSQTHSCPFQRRLCNVYFFLSRNTYDLLSYLCSTQIQTVTLSVIVSGFFGLSKCVPCLSAEVDVYGHTYFPPTKRSFQGPCNGQCYDTLNVVSCRWGSQVIVIISFVRVSWDRWKKIHRSAKESVIQSLEMAA